MIPLFCYCGCWLRRREDDLGIIECIDCGQLWFDFKINDNSNL